MVGWSFTLADHLWPTPGIQWELARQVGVTAAVSSIPDGPSLPPVWDLGQLAEMKETFADHDLDLQVIESSPHSLTEPIRLGANNADECLDRFCELLGNMAQLDIRIICPHWMPVFGPLRTPGLHRERGGAEVTAYTHTLSEALPSPAIGKLSRNQLWENAERFLEYVIPVAEELDIRVAIHPDDPPVQSIRGIDRILTSPAAVQRWLDLVPSPSNGLAFCQGTFASMGVDIPATIRQLGSLERIHYVHFRDIRGRPDDFVETFHDNGQTDMFAAIAAYRELNINVPIRVDHVPTLAGETTEIPGYATLGRLYAIGYLKGLMEGVKHLEDVPTETGSTEISDGRLHARTRDRDQNS